MAQVYVIGFPSGKVYVGITYKTAQQRFEQHLCNARGGGSYAVHHAIRKYGKGVRLIILAQGVPWAEAKELEMWWISRLGTFGPGGYNLTGGGEGMVGYVPTDETRAKSTPAARAAAGEKARKRWQDPAARVAAAERGRKQFSNPVARATAAERGRKQFSDPAARAAQAEGMREYYSNPVARATLARQRGPNGQFLKSA